MDDRTVIKLTHPPRRRAARLWFPAVTAALGLCLMATTAHADKAARSAADALFLAHATSVPRLEPGALGVDAEALDSGELSKQHGKGTTRPGAAGTHNVAVILWDERGSQGGQTTRVSMTGAGNIQSSTVSLSLR